MAFVGVLVEEKGKETVGITLAPEPGDRDPAFERAVADLKARKVLDDPASARIFADHFAEVAIARLLDQDEAGAGRAANALAEVMRHDYLVVLASRLRDDLEIVSIDRLDADSPEQAEALWTETLERKLSAREEGGPGRPATH